ncbi:protein singles bar [Anoplophora glabripennis]|uniref:protein singles bar n=1 Tax=Anoplophora glabripennis TaxID=217634 RepID=UPI0008751CC9|nr:protein singles bar [Anoplophora glabripennis]
MNQPRTRGPTMVTVHSSGGGGVHCCCCRCCTCLQLHILRTEPGILKLAEIGLGFFCQSLALNFGVQYAGTLGASLLSFITTASWCLMTSFLLMLCYVFSQKSFNLLKSSLFETAFNSIAAFSYITSCSYLGYAVNVFLQPMYLVTPYFQVYPAMSAAYMVGTLAGVVYGYDAYKSYKYFKGYR